MRYEDDAYNSDDQNKTESKSVQTPPKRRHSKRIRNLPTKKIALFTEKHKVVALTQQSMEMDDEQPLMNQTQEHDVPSVDNKPIVSVKSKIAKQFAELKSFAPPDKILTGDRQNFITWRQKIEPAKIEKFVATMAEFANIFEMAFLEATQIKPAPVAASSSTLTPPSYLDWPQIYLKILAPHKEKLSKNSALIELLECIEDVDLAKNSQHFIQLHSLILSHCFNIKKQRIIQPQQRSQANLYALIQYAGLCRQAQAWFAAEPPELKTIIAAVKLGNGASALNLRDLYINQLSTLKCEPSILEVIDVFLKKSNRNAPAARTTHRRGCLLLLCSLL